MKNICLLLVTACLLASCGQVKLNKDEVAALIRTARQYPKALEYDVNMADPASARKLLDAGMEEQGLVTIDKSQKLIDIGKPIVHFTEKAKPFLLRIDPKYDNVQVVKIADTDVGEITGIQLLNQEKRANVEYAIQYKNITPFAKLLQRDLNKPTTQRAALFLFDSGWKLEERP